MHRKMFDRRCTVCDWFAVDVWEPTEMGVVACPQCRQPTERAWITRSSGVLSDECDVYVKHAICHADGSPKRYTSKAEMARAAKEAGYTNKVEHIGSKGSDKNPHTTRWI